MRTVLTSRTAEVAIGPDEPFRVIGQRIDPTGRKAFADALRAGDLSQAVLVTLETIRLGRDAWGDSWIASHRRAQALAG